MNKVMLIGRLGADPELRYTPDGTAVCTMSIATDESYTDRQGSRVERTEWHRVAVFRKQAENCGRFLKKGALVYVEGRLQTRKWQDAQGRDRYVTEIRSEDVRFLERRPREDGQDVPQFAPPAHEPPVGRSRGGKYLPEGTPPPAAGPRAPQRSAGPGFPQNGYGQEPFRSPAAPSARGPRPDDGGYRGGYEGGSGAPGFGGNGFTPDDPFAMPESTIDKCPL